MEVFEKLASFTWWCLTGIAVDVGEYHFDLLGAIIFAFLIMLGILLLRDLFGGD
jgi:hypothetical protein